MIYDTSDNSILSSQLTIRSGQAVSLQIKVDCNTGYYLRGEAVADIALEAKHSGAGGYTNIETTDIDLGTWNGTTQTFDVRLTAGTITSWTRRAFAITVGR